MKASWRKLLSGAFVALAAITVAWTATTAEAEVDTVRINSAAFPISLPIHVASLKGFFEDEGLELKLQDFPSGAEAMEGFRAGRADFVVTGFLPTLILASRADVRIVSTLAGASEALIILAGSEIKGAQDLKGKKIGLLIRSDSAFLLDLYLEQNGLKTDDVEWLNLTPSDQMAALKNGDIAAAAVWQPFGILREKLFRGQDIQILADQRTVNMGRIWSSFLTNTDFVKENPDTTRKVLRVLLRATEWVDNASMEELTELLADFYRLDPVIFQQYIPMWKPRLNLTDQVAGEMSRMQNWALEKGIIETPVNFKKVFATDILGSIDPSLLKE